MVRLVLSRAQALLLFGRLQTRSVAKGQEAVSEILCVDRVYLVSLFGISELIPKIANQIGWQIG